MLSDFLSNPIAGAGQDAYLKHFPTATGQGSHSFPIEVLHATGLFGFLAYLYVHLSPIVGAWFTLRKADSADPAAWHLVGLLAAFVSICFASFTNLIFWGPPYWLLLGLLVVALRTKYVSRPTHSENLRTRGSFSLHS
jgi:hypothetical protein